VRKQPSKLPRVACGCRAYPAMERFVVLERGGHFLASEDPHRFVAEIPVIQAA
jgi:hypothetical protein